MDQRAKTKIAARLSACRSALTSMERTNNLRSFSIHWVDFITAAKAIYTILETGSREHSTSRTWLETKNQFRRGDPLLHYIYEARNDEEHGLGESTEVVPGGLGIGRNLPGYSNSIVLNTLPDGSLHVASQDGKPVLIQALQPEVRLLSVVDRKGRSVPPPTSHLGETVSPATPLGVARLALAYLDALVKEATALPSVSPPPAAPPHSAAARRRAHSAPR